MLREQRPQIQKIEHSSETVSDGTDKLSCITGQTRKQKPKK